MRRLNLITTLISLPLLLQTACGSMDDTSELQSQHSSGIIVRSAAGTSPASIQRAVDQFRADLGGGVNNLNAVGTQDSGRREINWDGVPAARSAPNVFPGDTFLSRGILMGSSGVKLQVSTNRDEAGQAEPLFGNLNPKFPNVFTVFSPEKIFAPANSLVTELTFTVPGSTTKATVNGFGSIFTGVELAMVSRIDYFDESNKWLHTEFVKPVPGKKKSLSFVGVSFKNGKKVGKVLITSGNLKLNSPLHESKRHDAVAMDDFIYGEPQKVSPRW
ncbi:MAG: hypothetical protein ACOH5I_21245 [Oligoflexus sp.]